MIIKLASVNAGAVVADLIHLIPGWNFNRMSPIGEIAFVKLPDVVLQEPVYDEEDNLVTAEYLAGETRYDVIVPDDYVVPVLHTRVFPNISDHQLY
jgi:hypothetical protein